MEGLENLDFGDLKDLDEEKVRAALVEDFRHNATESGIDTDFTEENVRIISDEQDFETLKDELHDIPRTILEGVPFYNTLLKQATFNISDKGGHLSKFVINASRHEFFHHNNITQFVKQIDGNPADYVRSFRELVGENNANYLTSCFFHDSYEIAAIMDSAPERVMNTVSGIETASTADEFDEIGKELQNIAETEGIGTIPEGLNEAFAFFYVFQSVGDNQVLNDVSGRELLEIPEKRETVYREIRGNDTYDDSVAFALEEIFGVYDNLSEFSDLEEDETLSYILNTVRERRFEAAERPDSQSYFSDLLNEVDYF